ncbi:MAG: hypothetical protein AAF211_31025, partial [Myxococcota bacterium]
MLLSLSIVMSPAFAQGSPLLGCTPLPPGVPFFHCAGPPGSLYCRSRPDIALWFTSDPECLDTEDVFPCAGEEGHWYAMRLDTVSSTWVHALEYTLAHEATPIPFKPQCDSGIVHEVVLFTGPAGMAPPATPWPAGEIERWTVGPPSAPVTDTREVV